MTSNPTTPVMKKKIAEQEDLGFGKVEGKTRRGFFKREPEIEMSLVFDSREIAVGPTLGYRAAGKPTQAYVSKEQMSGGGGGGGAQEGAAALKGFSRFSDFMLSGDESASTESSSIGAGGESSGESEGEDEVQSGFEGGLGSMGSLEESLPVKRGLSNFFSGKSRSFASLSDAMSVKDLKDLAKPENPLNKRRRILMAYKIKPQKRAFYGPLNTSMPNIILEEEGAEQEEEDSENSSPSPLPIRGRNFKCFKSPRSFSCTDLSDA